MLTNQTQTADRYRRSPGAVIYWVEAQAVCFVWQSGTRIPLTTEALAILQRLTEWTSASDLRNLISPGGDVAAAASLLRLFHSIGLLEREAAGQSDPDWLAWSPEAAFFHFATKNGVFPEDLAQPDRDLAIKATGSPPPPPTKCLDGRRIQLPSAPLPGELGLALRQRRTWRRYSGQPVPADRLGALLEWTFKVQARGRVHGQGDVIVRTSPSGGSRHPIEAYLLAWNVEGLAPGAYHYDSATGDLVDLAKPVSAADIPGLLAHQTYFAGAAAAVVLCPVFARTMWRYGHSRAYRTVLIDAGHLGQTFVLAATALGLAPFTTMAFSESALESLLGLDGIRECPIYVAGVGMPDPGAGANPGRWHTG